MTYQQQRPQPQTYRCVCGEQFSSDPARRNHIRTIAEMQRSHFGRLTSYHAPAA